MVKKLGPFQTYFSLLKGFVAIGILYMPKNARNGGWAFTLMAMTISFFITYFCLMKLLWAREKVPGGSFADIANAAMGRPGKYAVDIFLTIMQYGFVVGLIYFALESLKSVVDEVFDINISIIYLGILIYYYIHLGIFTFVVVTPLLFVRGIEKFAFTYIIADILILITAITIVVFATIHYNETGHWGSGVKAINTNTWLTMIGSAIYAFEGIGVVIPIIEVTENPKQFPKILLAVLITDMILYTSFGEYCLFVYGDELEGKPLITMILKKGLLVWTIKILYSFNVIATITLQAFPANRILESYIYKGMKTSLMKTWLINL